MWCSEWSRFTADEMSSAVPLIERRREQWRLTLPPDWANGAKSSSIASGDRCPYSSTAFADVVRHLEAPPGEQSVEVAPFPDRTRASACSQRSYDLDPRSRPDSRCQEPAATPRTLTFATAWPRASICANEPQSSPYAGCLQNLDFGLFAPPTKSGMLGFTGMLRELTRQFCPSGRLIEQTKGLVDYG